MTLDILDKVPIENFVIENNIIKGVRQDMPESYQIGKILFDVLDSKPDHVSQIQAETEERTTFAEMKENSVRCALWLQKQGIGRGDVVTTFCENDLHAYIAVFATFYIGAIHNAWNENLSLNEVQYLIKTLQPKIIIVSGKTVDTITQAAKVEDFHGQIVAYNSQSNLPSLKDLLQQQPNDEVKNFQPRTLTNPEDVAYIILTSGTTGLQKVVPHTYGNIVKHIATGLSYAMKGVLLTYAHWNWMTGFLFYLQNLLNRGTRILHRQFDPEETSKVIEKFEVERIFLLPHDFCLLCKSKALKNYQFESLKLVLVGGAMVYGHVLDEFRKKLPHVTLINAMGATEMGRMIVSQTERSKSSSSVGFVMSGIEVKICDLETNSALGPNTPGELCVRSSARTIGYYRDEAATNAVFDNEGWFHTGDAAYYNENGEFFVIDRITAAMKYRSHRVWPNEIEAVLITHPEVVDVGVVSIPHEVDGEHPMAFVKKAPGSKVREEELVKLSERKLGDVTRLRGGVKFIDEVPRLNAAKIDRRTLKVWAKTMKEISSRIIYN